MRVNVDISGKLSYFRFRAEGDAIEGGGYEARL